MKILLIILMLLPISTNTSFASDYDSGLEAALSGDFQTAFNIWMPLAKQGDPYAQNGLGMLYRRGDGVNKDPKEAAKWFQLSADQGFLMPMYSLGEMYEIGEGVPKDYEKSFELYSVAAENGLADAQTTLGMWYEAGHGGLKQDYEKSVEWYLLAAKQQDVTAMCRVAYRYEDGLGIQKDEAKAEEYLNAVIALGRECGVTD
jgi:uncharacterized protein